MSEKVDIFCKILDKELLSEVVLESEDWIAIRDIHPQTPVHVLIIPRKHVADISEATSQDAAMLGQLLLGAHQVAVKLRISETGYRLIVNHGEHGGQLIPHLHVHVLGGKHLGPKIVHDKA